MFSITRVALAAAMTTSFVGAANAALVGHYTFDDLSDAAIGEGAQNLTLHGDAQLTDGALVLGGTGYATANSNFVAGASGVTIGAWFALATDAQPVAIAQMPILGGAGLQQSVASVEVVQVPNGLGIQSGGRSATSDAFQSDFFGSHHLVVGNTYFVAAVLDYVAKTASTYLYDQANDTWYAQTTNNRLFDSEAAPGELGLNIGRRADGQRYLEGSISEVRIYNTALGASEIYGIVPEPASLGLLAAGGLLVLARRRA